jgi:Heterokaryon incompatibility protein (HET)
MIHQNSHWLATRLLDVSARDKDSEDSIRVALGSNLAAADKYVTLSYYWGEDQSFRKLLSSNLSTLQVSMALRRLPRTFREAVQVTQRLSFRFL